MPTVGLVPVVPPGWVMIFGIGPRALVLLAVESQPGFVADEPTEEFGEAPLNEPAVPGAICVPPGPVCCDGIFAPEGPGAIAEPPPSVP